MRWLAVVLVANWLSLLGCDQTNSANTSHSATPQDSVTSQAQPPVVVQNSARTPGYLVPEFSNIDFLLLYQTVLLHGLTPAEQVERWSRYYRQRWVRWCGQLAYINKSSLLFRQLGSSSTYDVYLRPARSDGQPLPQLTIGRFYNYAGRLAQYDEAFHTIYLDQGVLFDAGPDGVPGALATDPPRLRYQPHSAPVVAPPASPPLPLP